MQAAGSRRRFRPGRAADLADRARPSRLPMVPATLIGGAWLISLAAQASGNAGLLHHHALIEGGLPLGDALLLFLLGWQVMIAAMMLPASLPMIRAANTALAGLGRPGLAEAAFLGAFAVTWTVFGVLAFAGDLALHHLVDATPWLAARPWLIEGSVLALAGAYQLLPLKRRSLAACRHPVGLPSTRAGPRRGGFRRGLDHGLVCLGSSGALMLLMFAEGFANLGWMVALTVIMTYEATGHHGQRAAWAAGLGLCLVGLIVLTGLGPPPA